MTPGFDDFAKKRAAQKDYAQKLPADTAREWQALKGFVGNFEGKAVDGYKFAWGSDPTGGRPLLVLNYVAAMFQDAVPRNGVGYKVRFSRRPPGPNEEFAVNPSPLQPETWSLEPSNPDGKFGWSVPQLRSRPFSSADLAEEITKRLTTYHDEYEKNTKML